MKQYWKKIGSSGFVFLVCVMLLCFVFCADEAKAAKKVQGGGTENEYEYLYTTEKVQSFSQTKISWKKKNVDRYVIYQVLKDGAKRKKIAVLSGDKTSYIMKTKKNQIYSLEIRGVRYKKGTKKLLYECFGQPWFYSGVTMVGYGDYTWAEGFVSAKKIELDVCVRCTGIKPDGILIYRKKQGEKKYQKTAKLKWSKISDSWADNKVKARETYFYKIRAYKKIGGKMYYGPYSERIEKRAVRMSGQYFLSGDPDDGAPVLHVTGNKENGELIFYPEYCFRAGYRSKADEKTGYRLNGISRDGKNWMMEDSKESKNKISVDGAEGFYLRFEKTDLSEMDEYELEEDWGENFELEGDYNGIASFFRLSPYAKTGGTYQNSEAIH